MPAAFTSPGVSMMAPPPPEPAPRGQQDPGFWARIAFRDATYPWRYGFVRQWRMFDQSSGPKGEVKSKDANGSNPIGEQSLWNKDGTTPAISCYGVAGSLVSIPQGTVVNWAEETSRNPGVPIGAIVWVYPGETYAEPDTQCYRDDWCFQWSGLRLLFGKTTGTVHTGDATFTVNTVTSADSWSDGIVINSSQTIIVNNWTGDWSCSAGGVTVMFVLIDLTAASGSIGHGNFVQGPCPT